MFSRFAIIVFGAHPYPSASELLPEPAQGWGRGAFPEHVVQPAVQVGGQLGLARHGTASRQPPAASRQPPAPLLPSTRQRRLHSERHWKQVPALLTQTPTQTVVLRQTPSTRAQQTQVIAATL